MEPTKRASVLVDLIKRSLREYAESLILALVVAFFIRAFVVGAYKIPTTTMFPNLVPGDLVVALKWPYLKAKWLPFTEGEIRRGDLVVFKCPDNSDVSCVKRVIGLPGEVIIVNRGRVSVNGRPFMYRQFEQVDIKKTGGELLYKYQESILGNEKVVFNLVLLSSEESEAVSGPQHEIVVPSGHYYLLGDNREVIDDSREWGVLPEGSIKGRLLRVLFSLDWENPTFFNKLPVFRSDRWFQDLSISSLGSMPVKNKFNAE